MTKYAYRVFQRTREIVGGEARQWNGDLGAQLDAAGENGWELVAVVPRCDKAASTGSGANGFGATTSEDWVFKRALEG